MKTEGYTTIEASEDDPTASGSDEEPGPTLKALGKRKLSLEVEEKVEWSDSDDGYARLKKRATKRGHAQSSKSSKAPKKRAGPSKKVRLGDVETYDEPDEPFDIANVPDYLRARRTEFNRNRELLRDSGLLLPPDYADIEFSDDERLDELEERPKFDESSGVKPSRPYKDVELEYSAGLVPASIAQYLRDYQVIGVKFLHKLFVYQKGGILGDDMGLGKTVQVAAFLTAAFGKTGDERDNKRMRKMRWEPQRWYPRILIVCPGSLIQNWKNELNRWGWWHVDLFHGANKEDVLSAARAGLIEIMITTYATYKNHKSLINTVKWDAVIADECHSLKEVSSETTKAMNEVNALCRIGLTGTAIQNKYDELWTLLNWTNPGHFGTAADWRRTITTPLTVGQSHDATFWQLKLARETARKLVVNLLPGFFLRRVKALIAHQLPRKTDRVVFCPLTNIQREAYKNFLDSETAAIIRMASEECDCKSGKTRGWCCYSRNSDGRTWMELVFPAIWTLRKLANHVTLLVPSAVDPTDKQESELKMLKLCLPDNWPDLYKNRESMINLANPELFGKWKVLKKLLRFWHGNGDKVLVFSHSVRLLRILQYLFSNTSYNVSYLDGSLSYEDRQTVVDEFNSDPAQFAFLISTKAGGVGLNITSANKVVIVDPHWNPSHDLQAQDRAYRIGQTRDVDVFRLISAGTIDEIVYARQIYKQQQANIGYNASAERRYFKGVQQDPERRGEIFGLANLFSYHDNQVVLRDIVNKTNIAEAKVGVNLVGVDIEKAIKDEEELSLVKQEGADGEDDGMSQLAAFLTTENKQAFLDSKEAEKLKNSSASAIQAILASAGVEYTHENSEVVGTSKVEEHLSRRAEMAVDSDANVEGNSALFANPEDGGENTVEYRLAHVYNPPDDVRRRQFCTMAKEFGFANATDFALVVEGLTQEQRRNCLDLFYKRREAWLAGLDKGVKKAEDADTEMDDGEGRSMKSEKLKREKLEVKMDKVKAEDTNVALSMDGKSTSIFIDDDEDDEL